MPELRTEGPSHDAEAEAARHVASALGWSFVDLEAYSISCGVLRKVSAELACRARAVPMVYNARRVILLVDDAFQGVYLATHPEYLGPPYRKEVEIAFTTRRGLDRALERRLTLVNG